MKNKTVYIFFAMAVLVFNVSCKTKKVLATTASVPTKGISQSQIAANYYKSQKDFKTLYLKTDVDYQDEKRAQSVSAEIKISKDKMILVSVRFLGFTVAKALITPEKVQYYEKLGSKYFEGDYSTISEWLGSDLDFKKIQNMILGQPFDDLAKGKYTVDAIENSYQLSDAKSKEIQKLFTFSSANFFLLKQEVKQDKKNRKVTVEYVNHEEYPEGILPRNTNILAIQNDKSTSVKIEIRTAKYNEELTFPYSVPSGYSKIEMK